MVDIVDVDALLGAEAKRRGEKPLSRAQEMNALNKGPAQKHFWKHKKRKQLRAYEAANPGVNLEKGASWAQRVEVALHPTEKDAIMQKIFGNDSKGKPNFRKNKTGDYIIKAPNGEEILFDERGLAWKDLADFTGSAVEMGGAMATGVAAALLLPVTAAAAVNPLTWIGIAGLSLLTAFGGQAAGGSVELAAKYARRVPIDLIKTTERRAEGTAWDTALGMLFGGLFKIFRGGTQAVFSPLAADKNLPGNVAIKESAKRVTDIPYAGIGPAQKADIQLTAGQQLGSPVLLRQESIAEKVPGSAGDIANIMRNQEIALRNAQANVSGQQVSAMEVGDNILNQVDDAAKTLQAQASAARGETEKAVNEGVESVREGMVRPRQPQNATEPTLLPRKAVSVAEGVEEAGNVGVNGVLAKRKGFQDTVRSYYNDVRSTISKDVPGDGSFFPTTNTKGAAKDIVGNLPKEKDIIEEIPTGLLDAAGRPLVRTEVTPGGPAKAYVPPEVMRFLRGHGDLADTQTFDAIIQMRRIVNDAIQMGEGLPGVSTRYLKQIGAALTKDLGEGVALSPGGEKGVLGTALNKAASYYKNNFAQYQTPEIAGIFREATQTGKIDALGLMEKLSHGRGSVKLARQLKAMLNDSEWGQIRRGLFDDILDKAENSMDYDSFNPSALYSTIRGLGPEMRGIVFGDQAKQVQELAKVMAARHGNLSLSKIKEYPDNLTKGLKEAAKIEAKETELFQNVILKEFMKGKTGESAIQPDAFIRHMMKTGSPKQIKKAMELFSPELQQSIQDKAVQTVIQDSYRKPTTMEVVETLSKGKPAAIMQGDKFLELLQTGYGHDVSGSGARLKAIIGQERIDQLKDIAIVSSSRQRADEAASMAGGIQSGMVLHKLMSGELISGLTTVAKGKLVNILIQSKIGRGWLTNGVVVPAFRGTQRAMLHAGPTIERIKTELANEPDAVNQILGMLGLDPIVTEQGSTPVDLDQLLLIEKESRRRKAAGEAPVGVEPGGDPIAAFSRSYSPTAPPGADSTQTIPPPAMNSPTAPPKPGADSTQTIPPPAMNSPTAPPQAAPTRRAVAAGVAGNNPRTQEIFESLRNSAAGQQY